MNENLSNKEWKFSEILADQKIRAKWDKVRKYFFLRESTYDIANRCNIRCEGCYYYEGDKQFAEENRDPAAWRERQLNAMQCDFSWESSARQYVELYQRTVSTHQKYKSRNV